MTNYWPKFFLIIALFFIFSFTFVTDNSFDQDLGRHIKLGEIIWQTGAVPETNLFSYTYPDFPFFNHHWLFQVLVYLASVSVGIEVMLVLKVLIFLACGLLIFTLKSNFKSALFLPLAFLFAHLLRDRLELRPEIFSFLFTALTLWILERVTSGEKKKVSKKVLILLGFLPLIQLLWVNLHIYFLVGLMIQGVFLVSFLAKKDWLYFKILLFIFIASLLATLANPHFISGALYPLNIFANYGYQIQENQNIFFLESLGFNNPNYLLTKLGIVVSLAVLVVTLLKKRLELKNALLVLLGVSFGLLNVRSMPYLFLISLPALLALLSFVKPSKLTLGLSFFTALLILIESIFYLSGAYYLYQSSEKKPTLLYTENIKGGAEFMVKNSLPQPIFNNFDIGSYLSYKGYPQFKTYVDGRPEAYPVEFFQQEYIPSQEDYKKFEDLEAKRGFKTAIFSITDQTPWASSFLSQISRDSSWKMVYLDDFVVIYVKEAGLENLAVLDAKNLDLSLYNFESAADYDALALFLLNIGEVQKADEALDKALAIFPEDKTANLVKAQILSQQQTPYGQSQAKMHIEKAANFVFW